MGQPTPLHLVQANEVDRRHDVRESHRYRAFRELERYLRGATRGRTPRGMPGSLQGGLYGRRKEKGLYGRSILRGLLGGSGWTGSGAVGQYIL